MNIEPLKSKLVDLRSRIPGGLAGIARESGISLSWLDKFLHGRTRNPTLRRIEQLQRYLTTHSPPNEGRTT